MEICCRENNDRLRRANERINHDVAERVSKNAEGEEGEERRVKRAKAEEKAEAEEERQEANNKRKTEGPGRLSHPALAPILT